MDVCSSCGNPIRQGDRFCLYCGKPFISTKHQTSYHILDDPQWIRESAQFNQSTAANLPPIIIDVRNDMSQPPRFTWKSSDGTNHTFDLTAAEISIGRAPTCDIVLPDDQMVSRRHAIARRQGMNVVVIDLGSSNGTIVNGAEIRDATVLRDADRVMIGDQEILFTVAKESETPFQQVQQPVFAAAAPAAQSFGAPVAPPFFAPVPQQSYQEQVEMVSEQDTGNLDALPMQQFSFNAPPAQPEPVHFAAPVASAPPDALSLLSTVKDLNEQLTEQIRVATQGTDRVLGQVSVTLSNLDNALNIAQSASQQAMLNDLQQLAAGVNQSPMVDLVASFARRAGEIRDVIAAHQQLLISLEDVRHQLQSTLNNR